MTDKKIDFSNIEWEKPSVGIKSKSFEKNGKRFRLLELSKGLIHPEWCEVGHIGYVVDGELEIVFINEIVRYLKSDALNISSGKEEKHIPKPISEKVILFLIEDV